MSLTDEWFSGKFRRMTEWDVNGLSLREAEMSLCDFDAGCNAIANEMAEYIFGNWTARRVALLNYDARNALFEIWDDVIFRREKQQREKHEEFSLSVEFDPNKKRVF